MSHYASEHPLSCPASASNGFVECPVWPVPFILFGPSPLISFFLFRPKTSFTLLSLALRAILTLSSTAYLIYIAISWLFSSSSSRYLLHLRYKAHSYQWLMSSDTYCSMLWPPFQRPFMAVVDLERYPFFNALLRQGAKLFSSTKLSHEISQPKERIGLYILTKNANAFLPSACNLYIISELWRKWIKPWICIYLTSTRNILSKSWQSITFGLCWNKCRTNRLHHPKRNYCSEYPQLDSRI